MYEFSVIMGLVDFFPVMLFLAAVVILQRDLYRKISGTAYALFSAGSLNVALAGGGKALWKLLYGAGICDFRALSSMFLPVQSIGFLMAGLGLLGLFLPKRRMTLYSAAAPAVYKGVMLFIAMMVIGLGLMCGCLIRVSFKLKAKRPAVFLALSFLCSLGMGAIAGKDSSSAAVNWLEQAINCVGQGLLLAGVIDLHRAGLKAYIPDNAK